MKKIFLICLAFSFFTQTPAQVPVKTLVAIVRAEDELRFDKTVLDLMKSPNAAVRARAALAAGRIGRDEAVAALSDLLGKDKDAKVRASAAFALGEIESVKGAAAILTVLQNTNDAEEIRARSVEAAGKIAAANPKEALAKDLGEAILDALEFEGAQGAKRQNRPLVLLGITAILRAKPEDGTSVAAKFLTNTDARVRSDAANTLSRLRAKNANELLRAMLVSDSDPIARANAARALGAAEDADSFDVLLSAALSDNDSRVRVSAIRSLGSLKNATAADKLLAHGETLLAAYQKTKLANPSEKNELLEIASTLGRILANTNNEKALEFLKRFREADKFCSPESEIAFAKVAPVIYLQDIRQRHTGENKTANIGWRQAGSISQGLAELPFAENVELKKDATVIINVTIAVFSLYSPSDDIIKALPEVLRTFVAINSDKSITTLRRHLNYTDVIVRATAAELLAEQPATKENVEALKTAFDKSLLSDKQENDAQLSILDALFKLDKKEAVPTLLLALNASDYLVRKKAFELLRTKDLEKDSPGIPTLIENALAKNKDRVLPRAANGSKLGVILNTNADYVRGVSRRRASAILTTEKGTFTIEFSPKPRR